MGVASMLPLFLLVGHISVSIRLARSRSSRLQGLSCRLPLFGSEGKTFHPSRLVSSHLILFRMNFARVVLIKKSASELPATISSYFFFLTQAPGHRLIVSDRKGRSPDRLSSIHDPPDSNYPIIDHNRSDQRSGLPGTPWWLSRACDRPWMLAGQSSMIDAASALPSMSNIRTPA
jgi:hypothetical protein